MDNRVSWLWRRVHGKPFVVDPPLPTSIITSKENPLPSTNPYTFVFGYRLLYNHHGRYFQAPVSYEQLEYASNFASEMCPEGMVAITGNTLRIFTVDNLGAMFNQTSFSLRYTPRKLCRVPNTPNLVVIETDQHE